MALLALIPLAALIVFQELDERESRRDAGMTEAGARASEVASLVGGFADEISSFTDAAAIVIGQEETISDQSVGPYLRSLKSRYPMLRGVVVTDVEGRVMAQTGGFTDGQDLGAMPYVTELREGKDAVWTHATDEQQAGVVMGSFSRVVRDVDGEPVAFLVATFQPTDLAETFTGIAGVTGDDSNLVLIDAMGRVVFSSTGYTQRLEDVSSSGRVQAALRGETVQIAGETTRFADDSRYGAIAPVEGMGWAVAYTRPLSALNASLASDLLEGLGLLALIMGAVVLITSLIARQMTSPLKRLARSASNIAEGTGDMEVPVQRDAAQEVVQLQQAFADMSESVRQREERLRDQAERLRSLEMAGASIVGTGLDTEKAVQAVTDAGTELTEAEFGAFFYNVKDENGESYLLHTLSGGNKAAFAYFPMPRVTPVFAPTFSGEGPMRLDDVTQDERYGQNPPHKGMPEGHPRVRSYLAVPVLSPQQEVLGGLFFGHSRPGVFTERHEALATRIASWASIALDNARLYEQERAIQEELRLANHAKDEFLGLISHELRTPVTTIYGGLRLLDSHHDLLQGKQGQEFVETMAEEGARLVRLIEDLLALTRVELGREIERLPANVNSLVLEAIDEFGKRRKLREVKPELDLGASLIEVEPTYFRQVLTNLLSNADKYSPEDKPVTVQTSQDGGDVNVFVIDSGPGVEAGEVDKIFDSFYRSQSTSGKAPGQGLGLTVCRKLVEAQQGRIWARNRETGGFLVGFSFPAMAATRKQDDKGSQAGARTDA